MVSNHIAITRLKVSTALYRKSLAYVLVPFFTCGMPETDPLPDPGTPEWTIAWAVKRVLRAHLGPRVERYLPTLLTEEILKALKLSRWRITKEPPDPLHSTPGE